MRRFTTESAGMVFPGSRRRALISAVGAVGFVVVGLGLMYFSLYPFESHYREPGVISFLVGLLCVGFFGLTGVGMVRAFVLGGNGIVLVADGVYFRAPGGRAWVRWEDLTSVGVLGGVVLVAHAPERIALTGLNRGLHGINRRKFGLDVMYPELVLNADPGAVVEWINHYHANPADRPELRHPATTRD